MMLLLHVYLSATKFSQLCENISQPAGPGCEGDFTGLQRSEACGKKMICLRLNDSQTRHFRFRKS